ncbi:MAG: hypothetical protein GY820_32085, partial [Gammaproteobacteria bacterium]|nr:hypothetical protein [Gammaproteobacteria bacterium]
MKLPSLARYCHRSERTVRRQLATLGGAAELTIKTKGGGEIEEARRIKVVIAVWQANKITGPNAQGKGGQFHKDIDKNANINTNNMTACEQPNVLRETCEDNEQKSDVILKNEEIFPPTTLPLGKRLGK